MRTSIALLALFASIVASAQDEGVLIGLRDPQNNVRTVLVARKGVAFVVREHKSQLIRPLKEAIQTFEVSPSGVKHGEHVTPINLPWRYSWLSVSAVGIEIDASLSGERPFTRTVRRVLSQRGTERLASGSNLSDKARFDQAVKDARKKLPSALASMLPDQPDEYDWGYVRNEAKWSFVTAFVQGSERREFAVPGLPPTSNPPYEYGEIPWRAVVSKYADATDIVASRHAEFAVVITDDYLYVHEATRTALGRMVRRFPVKSESLVCAFWGGGGPLERWLEHIKG